MTNVLLAVVLLHDLLDSINMLESFIIAMAFNIVQDKSRCFMRYGFYSLLFSDFNNKLVLFYVNYDDLRQCCLDLVNVLHSSMYELISLNMMGMLCIATQLSIITMGQSVRKSGLDRLPKTKQDHKGINVKSKRLWAKRNRKCEIFVMTNDIRLSRKAFLLHRFRNRKHLLEIFKDLQTLQTGCIVFSLGRTLSNILPKFKTITKMLRNKVFITNLHRKIFHFFTFCIFYSPTPLKIRLGEFAFFTLMLLSNTAAFRLLFAGFLSRNDRGRFVVSHVYLLAAVLFPYYLLSYKGYLLNLTSVCILDSFSSFTGICLGKKSKSLAGTLGALILTLIFAKTLLRFNDPLYFTCAALVEQFPYVNDNISLPLFSILYFKFFMAAINKR